jgi:hypothetical protein
MKAPCFRYGMIHPRAMLERFERLLPSAAAYFPEKGLIKSGQQRLERGGDAFGDAMHAEVVGMHSVCDKEI